MSAMEPAELEQIVARHQHEVFRYLRYLGLDRWDVTEELVQETFLAAYAAKDRPPLDEPKRVAGWLRGIARNKLKMHWRTKSRSKVAFDSDAMEGAEAYWAATVELVESDDMLDALRECMKKLTDRDRQVLDMRYRLNRPRVDMGRVLGLTPDGVKSLLRRIRQGLADCMQAHAGERS